MPFDNLRIDFGDLGLVVAPVDREERFLPQHHAAEIEFIDLRGELEAVGGIDLSQHRALRLGLADFGVQRRQLAIHRGANGERFDGGIGDCRAVRGVADWVSPMS